MSAEAPSVDELRAIFLARDLREGEFGLCGIASGIPLAAMRLAQEVHAPSLIFQMEGAINPRTPYLAEAPDDPRSQENAEATLDQYDIFVASEQGADFWFMNGVQTDQWGNLNHQFVGGTLDHPRFRAPGNGNINMATTADRWYNYAGSHTPRQFVPVVEFISALGNGPERQALGDSVGGGCRFVVSPIAVLDFETPDRRMRLLHVMPGVAVEDVVSRTGFELAMAPEVTEIPEPTPEELDVLRRVVDPTGLLRT